ncbi:TetR/AcrR family transcriptional regulator [Acinetobacter baylyi]|nr:TetR/AcrR family transcriptional regulator [Acinetobacter baylyi]
MEKSRGPGRPKDKSKEITILAAARKLFLEIGLDVTTDAIALEAGVAKSTIYSYFSDKENLLEAVIRLESDLTISDEQFEQSLSLPLYDVLKSFGLRYVNFINNREVLGWDRLIAAAAIKTPDLPERFFAAGPGRGQYMLIALLCQAIAKGELKQCDPQVAADNLTGLWLGFTSLEVKLGVKPALTPQEIENRVEHGINVFMAFYAIKDQIN